MGFFLSDIYLNLLTKQLYPLSVTVLLGSPAKLLHQVYQTLHAPTVKCKFQHNWTLFVWYHPSQEMFLGSWEGLWAAPVALEGQWQRAVLPALGNSNSAANKHSEPSHHQQMELWKHTQNCCSLGIFFFLDTNVWVTASVYCYSTQYILPYMARSDRKEFE